MFADPILDTVDLTESSKVKPRNPFSTSSPQVSNTARQWSYLGTVGNNLLCTLQTLKFSDSHFLLRKLNVNTVHQFLYSPWHSAKDVQIMVSKRI